MPFTCVKGLGPKASEEIASHKPYKDFNDFFARVNKTKVNKSVVEKLIFCGCFDSFRKSEQQLINDYYELRGEKIPEKFASVIKSDINEHRAKGLSFLSMDYYAIYPKFFPSNEVVNFIDLVSGKKSVAIGGVIGKITKKKTKHNHEYCDFIVTNDGEDLSIRVWPEEYSFYKDVIEEKVVVKVIGNTSEYNGKLQFTATNISALTKG
jgi:DNA polymerase III alpha subunit